MGKSKEKENSGDKGVRNSVVRDLAKKPVTKIVEVLHSALPWLTPNQITALGTTGVLGLCIYTLSLEKKGKIDPEISAKLLATFLALSVSDALDGGLARLKAENGDVDHDSKTGALVDTLSDRLQEAFLSWLAMSRAVEQGDKLALTAALATALTNPLSSFFRAWAEANNVVVPESGSGISGLFGTRVGKSAASSVRFLPRMEVGGVSVQAIVDTLVAASTIKVAVSRFMAVIENSVGDEDEMVESQDLDDEMSVDAKRRLKWLGATMALTTAGTVFLLKSLLDKKENQ